jgi:hypothetical protein
MKFFPIAKHGSESEMFQAERMKDAAFGSDWVGNSIIVQCDLLGSAMKRESNLTSEKYEVFKPSSKTENLHLPPPFTWGTNNKLKAFRAPKFTNLNGTSFQIR